MNIEGLDYNTQREKLLLPEYGREIQKMVDYAVQIPNREERQVCAETIIDIMYQMFPHNRNDVEYGKKLWDHLALMSNFQLDIDYPFDISQALTMAKKPEPMPYPMKRIPVRHYGSMVFELFEQLKTMPEGEERNELMRLTANQMKRDLYQWSNNGSLNDEKVVDDLARFTDGKIQLDLNGFQFEKITGKDVVEKRRKKR